MNKRARRTCEKKRKLLKKRKIVSVSEQELMREGKRFFGQKGDMEKARPRRHFGIRSNRPLSESSDENVYRSRNRRGETTDKKNKKVKEKESP